MMKKKNYLIPVGVALVFMILTVSPARAELFTVGGRPLNVFGYATMGGAFSLNDKDYYDTEKGFQSALMNLFLEGNYAITNELKFYTSTMLTVDWAYQLKANDSSWHDKLFDKSRTLNVDDKYWQLLKEVHLSWTPKNFNFRIGKQIVAWGETDGFRLMDQINPQDTRRGFADVEFETSIIPIWLLKGEYFPDVSSKWLQDLGLEFVFNPNADFIPNQGPQPGNDVGGIWAPDILIPGPFPYGEAHMGSAIMKIENSKGHFNPDFYEYAFRVKAVIADSIVTLNYFYGRDNDPVTRLFSPFLAPLPPDILASDGRLILHPYMEGKYPLFRFVGGTFSRDIPFLKASFLGGVAPVVRLESFYAFSNTFATTVNRFIKSDDFRAAIGFDWKVKIPFLNPTAGFTISPQFYYRRIMDYPSIVNTAGILSGEEISGLRENNYQTTLMINTNYLHGKLVPSFFWFRDINSQSDMFRFQLVYDYSNKWHFTLGALLLDGHKNGEGFQLFEHKDQIYFKISYKWG